MYNGYIHDREKQKEEAKLSNLKKVKKSLTAQIKMRAELVKSHQRRTEKRILEMAENPVPIPRIISTARNYTYLGDPAFRFRPKNDEERIKDTLVKYQNLDPVPYNTFKFQFRQRLKTKEINPDLKFTPRDRYERIFDSLNQQKAILSNSWYISDKNNQNETKNGENVLPQHLHKTYYKTVESLALDVSPSLKGPSLAEVKINVKKAKKGLTGDPNLPKNPIIIAKLADIGKLKSKDDLILVDGQLSELAREVMGKCNLKATIDRSAFTSRSSSVPKQFYY
ncbi:unnamed protein product [Blepharisma stoltei]|uniref:Uncharacterized protein n=1 Tax=Blepharisma stoltei TaxID=1481888 RepID=A0AAU9J4E1_9CILI|nr:unnamed protein product [Blepharisma stoltei]